MNKQDYLSRKASNRKLKQPTFNSKNQQLVLRGNSQIRFKKKDK